MVRVAGQLERELRKGRSVEHVDEADAHRVERALEAASGYHRSDVIGDPVGLKQREERILQWKVAGAAGSA
jgi:hypothetical protein